MCKNIYGELDTANECIKRVNSKLAEDWKSGQIRLRQGDIERARKYIKTMNKSLKEIVATLKQFEEII